ncbi:MAG: metallophosphoesterase, partial [Armatimonadota bacterium]
SLAGAGVRAGLEPQDVGTTELRIGLPGLPKAADGLRISFLTDLHYGPDTPTASIIKAVSLVQHSAPDVILLGGDYIQWSMNHLSGIIPILAKLNAPLGVYGVLGNHDYYHPDLLSERLTQEARVHILRNSGVDLQNGLFVCGIEDTWRGRFDPDAATANRSKDSGIIALSHNPVGINLFRNERAFVMSGHTHGGQILVPGIKPHRAPGLGDFPILQGWYGIHGTAGFVSRGIGQTFLPLRLNCPPEIVLATLCALPAGDRCKPV